METGFLMKSACGKKYRIKLGYGSAFSKEYQEVLQAIREGKYGQGWKKLAEQNPSLAVDAEKKLFYCKGCCYWENDYDLGLYVPKNAEQQERVPYVTSAELNSDYRLLMKYSRICPECGANMKQWSAQKDGQVPLRCPDCGDILQYEERSERY